MDYFDLLHQAQKNKSNAANKEVRCYTTEFAPPKKIVKSNVSGDSIKKFLARKEEEEKKKLLQAQKKKEELLALRALDKKAQKRVQVMLKTTKSANKSVMEDAIDNVNTAHTLGGPKQCDEDDYGYVSQEASAFYEKLMSKYQNIPAEASKAMHREVKDLNAAKDRVKAALKKEEEEELHPHRKRRKKHEKEGNDEVTESGKDASTESETATKHEESEPVKMKEEPKKSKRQRPPPVDFFSLIKLAEQKQYEPIIIEKKVSTESERPMTMKEKLEYQREMDRKNTRKDSSASGNKKINEKSKPSIPSPPVATPVLTKISKKKNVNHDEPTNQHREQKSKPDDSNHTSQPVKPSSGLNDLPEKKRSDLSRSNISEEKSILKKTLCDSSSKTKQSNTGHHVKWNPSKDSVSTDSVRDHFVKNKSSESGALSSNSNNLKDSISTEKEMTDIDKEIELLLKKKAKLLQDKSNSNLVTESAPKKPKLAESCKKFKSQNSIDKTDNLGIKKDSTAKKGIEQKHFKPDVQKSVKQDVQKSVKQDFQKPFKHEVQKTFKQEVQKSVKQDSQNFDKKELQNSNKQDRPFKQDMQKVLPSKPVLKPKLNSQSQMKKPKKRVIDSESEYDSELDDFIDDGPEDEMDYSRHIKEIFGYDKSRYRDVDEDECEESSFKTQMIEERRSAKIGLLEDLEDIKREKEEKKLAMIRKQNKR